MLKRVKSVLIFTVALWGFIGVFGNLIDWSGTLRSVDLATSMSTVNGGDEAWQATSNPFVIWTGAIFIALSKFATGALCTFGAIGMWRAHNIDSKAYDSAKEIALVGCCIAIIMLFGGFIVVAAGWFDLYRSATLRDPVLQTAFQYAGMIGLIAIFVSLTDD